MSAAREEASPLDFEEDPRYAQANKEAWWAIGYWLAFTVGFLAQAVLVLAGFGIA